MTTTDTTTGYRHETVHAANGTTADLTLVWSTEPEPCTWGIGEVGHITVQWTAEDGPGIWDSTGCGDWAPMDYSQCGCGCVVIPINVLHSGHLTGAALDSIRASVARRTAEAQESVRDDIRRGLRRMLDDLDESAEGSETGPGWYRDGDTIVAWAYDPFGEGETIDEFAAAGTATADA